MIENDAGSRDNSFSRQCRTLQYIGISPTPPNRQSISNPNRLRSLPNIVLFHSIPFWQLVEMHWIPIHLVILLIISLRIVETSWRHCILTGILSFLRILYGIYRAISLLPETRSILCTLLLIDKRLILCRYLYSDAIYYRLPKLRQRLFRDFYVRIGETSFQIPKELFNDVKQKGDAKNFFSMGISHHQVPLY